MPKSRSGDARKNYQPKFKHFETMKFIKGKVNKKSSGNIDLLDDSGSEAEIDFELDFESPSRP